MVLLGDAFDTRPFRLPWPEGTVIYCVAPAAAHQQADAAFKAQQARVPRGCLLRRVPAELHQDGSFASALERSGLRGDRLSVWVVQVGAAAETRFPMSCLARQRLGYRPALCSCAAVQLCVHVLGDSCCSTALLRPARLPLQGISDLGLPPASLSTLLTDVCNQAAFDSLVTGLLPPLVRRDLDNLLASFG